MTRPTDTLAVLTPLAGGAVSIRVEAEGAALLMQALAHYAAANEILANAELPRSAETGNQAQAERRRERRQSHLFKANDARTLRASIGLAAFSKTTKNLDSNVYRLGSHHFMEGK